MVIEVPKGSSGRTATAGGKNVSAENIQPAGREVMTTFAKSASNAVKRFPELKGNPYVNLHEINQADIKTPGVLAYYGIDSKSIVVGNKTIDYQDQSDFHPAGTGNLEGVVAHELGHALSYHQLPGFRDVEKTVRIAHAKYNRQTDGKLTRAEFMREISVNAAESTHETFAEAFADWSVNGIKASKASLAVMSSWRMSKH